MMAYTHRVYVNLPEPEGEPELDDEELRESREFFDRFKRESRRYQRRIVRSGELLEAEAFCRRRNISRGELRRLERQRLVFSVEVGYTRYYPRFLATRRSVLRDRLTRVCRRISTHVPDWSRYYFFTTRWASIGDTTVLRAVRRPRGLQWSFTMANGISEEWAPRNEVSPC